MIDFKKQEEKAFKELTKENRRFRKKRKLSSHVRIPEELLTRLREEAWFKEVKIIDLLEEKLREARWIPTLEIQKTRKHIINRINRAAISSDTIRV